MIFRINMLGWWKVTILTAILVSGLRSLEVMADTVHKRTLDQLVSKDEPAWPLVKNWIRLAKNQVEVLPPDIKSRGDVLVQTQVTTKSPMGALIYETGGLIVDHGWLRILGSGHPKLPRSLPGWNLSLIHI